MPTPGTAVENVRARRDAIGLSAEKLARLADVGTDSVRRCERGYRPSTRVASRIETALSAAEAAAAEEETGP
jgi:predicted transcriptional regulator